MSRSRGLQSGPYEPEPPVKEPLLMRSIAGAVSIGAPIGLITWIAVQQMPTFSWALSWLLQSIGQ